MTEDDQDFLEELRRDFFDEATELLEKCEISLLNFEKKFDLNYYQEYMRIIHSLKGSARAVEFDNMASTIHLIEGLGLKVKEKEFVENSLRSIDGIKEALECLKKNDLSKMEDILTDISIKIS